jgi:hypothetical protein
LALVNRLSFIQSAAGPRVQIGCLDGTLVAARGRPGLDYTQLLGELVLFFRDAGFLRHAQLGEFPIRILPDSEIEDDIPIARYHSDRELKTKCPLCGRYYYDDEREEHLRRCPRKFPPQKSRKGRTPSPFVHPDSPPEWVRCSKCGCWVMQENVEGHEAACRGRKPVQKALQTTGDSEARELRFRAHMATKTATHQARIHDEAARIAGEAWEAAATAASPEARRALAKQTAIRLIRMLTPKIRREVENYFTSQKWAPLLSHQPKPPEIDSDRS